MRAIYSIEGNIGSGKSTFLNLLKLHEPKIQVIPEPVAEWQKISNKFNLLDEYYKDPNRWAFSFQINAVLSRAKELRKLIQMTKKQKQKNNIYFSQRSVVADKQIFANLLHSEGKMNQMEYALYLNMYESLQMLFETPRIHKFIYLRTTPQKCLQRMNRRARSQENSVKLDYLQKIHQLHQKWLYNQQNKIVINGEEQFQSNEKILKEMVDKVKIFLLS